MSGGTGWPFSASGRCYKNAPRGTMPAREGREERREEGRREEGRREGMDEGRTLARREMALNRLRQTALDDATIAAATALAVAEVQALRAQGA